MNFALYILGILLVGGGLAYGAFMLGVATAWIGVGLIILLGAGLMMGVMRTDPGDEGITDS